MAGLVVSALLGVGAKFPASMDAPVREVFHTPLGMSAPIEPLLLYQASQDEKCRHWVDSLSNRTYPDAWVNKLSKLEIREKIQETIYEAMKEK